jgi:hypothetical protein
VAVFAGGKPARLLAHEAVPGQEGVESLRFRLPADIALGCYVPVVVRVPGAVSNVVTISVSAANQPCPGDPAGGALVLLARLNLRVRLGLGVPLEFRQDIGAAAFPSGGSDSGVTPQEILPPAGTCNGFTGRLASGAPEAIAGEFPMFGAGTGRDAGPGITISGPHGELMLTSSPLVKNLYRATLGGGLSVRTRKPPFLDAGSYRITGSGGADVGEFAADVSYEPGLEWLNPERLDTVDRARGAVVKWRGVAARQRVIVIAANADPVTGAAGACVCLASAPAGQLRLPPLLLSNLPPSRETNIPQSYLIVATVPPADSPGFQARGLPNANIVFTTARGRTVRFK